MRRTHPEKGVKGMGGSAWPGLVKGLALGCALLLQACTPNPTGTQDEAAETPAPPGPALWRTGDADTTVYLLGTVHVLPPGLNWLTPGIENVLREADAVYFETDINPDAEELNRIIATLGRYPSGVRLSDQMNPDDRALLEQTARELDLPMFVLDGLRPWLASLTIAEVLIVRAGYDPTSGVERTLQPLALQAGKDIRKLETVEQQLLAFADLPEQVQLDYLVHGLEQVGEEEEMLAELVEAWRTGDVAALDRIMIDGDLNILPEVYDALLVRRNADWTNKLADLIASEPGVFLVAVGAGHLAGEDSLQVMLADRGLPVERTSGD